MGTTAQKLTYLNETKTLLKNKINITGANITNDTFRQYPTKLQNALLECWNNEGEPIFTNWGNKITSEGTNVKLDNTINARMKLTPKGNTSQTGTPTPSSPIPVNVVSGDNTITISNADNSQSQNYPLYLGVENLLNPVGTNVSSNGITFVNNGNGTFTVNGTATDNVAIPLTNLTTYPITLNVNETYSQTLYILSGDFGLSNKVSIVPAFKNGGGTITYNYFKSTKDDLVSTKTTTETMYAHTYNLYIGTGAVITNCTFKVQLEKGAKSNSYTPYGTTPIQLCNIGNYVDFPFKAVNGDKYYDTLTQAQKDLLTYGKWYLHKAVGKVVLNGSETWEKGNDDGNRYYFFTASLDSQITSTTGISNYFPIGYSVSGSCINLTLSYAHIRLFMLKTLNIDSVTALTQWLTSNNVSLYYGLATPIEEEITNTTLINQLEALKGAMSYEGQTNINGGFMIVGASALGELS